MGRLYFAYGSNLDLDGMAARCLDSEPVASATVTGWELTFRGVADIEPRKGVLTHGALWRISRRDLERLDVYEGYPRLYRREPVTVRTQDGPFRAIAYVMNDDYVGLPSTAYYEVIKRGYAQWGLPVIDLDMALAKVKDRLYERGSGRLCATDRSACNRRIRRGGCLRGPVSLDGV